MGKYQLSPKKLKVATDVCQQLEESGREVNAHNLVDVSRPEDAPLHKEFEWDDAVAGEKYREEQARSILRQVIFYHPESQEPIRKYYHVYHDDPTYYPIDVILKKPDMREQLLKNALKDLEAFKRKYSQLVELAAVFTAIDDFKHSV